MCMDLEVRLIMNLGLRLRLMMCRDLKILLGLLTTTNNKVLLMWLLELLGRKDLEVLLIMNLGIGLGLLLEIELGLLFKLLLKLLEGVLLLVLPGEIYFSWVYFYRGEVPTLIAPHSKTNSNTPVKTKWP